jgi:hypothetical protein
VECFLLLEPEGQLFAGAEGQARAVDQGSGEVLVVGGSDASNINEEEVREQQR